MYNLGVLHEMGLGVARDVTKSDYWFAEATAHGDAEMMTLVTKFKALIADSTDYHDNATKGHVNAMRNLDSIEPDGLKDAGDRTNKQNKKKKKNDKKGGSKNKK